jgi:hypothetical protein
VSSAAAGSLPHIYLVNVKIRLATDERFHLQLLTHTCRENPDSSPATLA